MAKTGEGSSDEMDSLYSGSMGPDDQADTSKDTSGDDETIDQQDQEEMAKSSVVPMSTLKGTDGKPLKRGDKVEVVVMDVFGGKDCKICRADQYPDEKYSDKSGDGEEEPADQEIDRLSSQRM